MDYYDASCKIETIQFRMECFAEMLATLAEAESDNTTSGTFWFIKDTINRHCEELENLSGELMENHIAAQTTLSKPKKNANKTKNK